MIFMKEKRIQFYDSMGGDGEMYLQALFQYLKDEHQSKHGCPLPDEDEWELVPCTRDTPQQRNGEYEGLCAKIFSVCSLPLLHVLTSSLSCSRF
jgi:Ulp1 family protease